jgi:FKBP-type peptidyl-prolyl cis-trans isomerase
MIRVGASIAVAAILASASAHAADPALSAQANVNFLTNYAKQKGVVTTPDGLEYKIIQNGFGPRPTAFDSVSVSYKGALINGTVFDSTEPGLPANFKVNQVIPGWTEALELMREGDHWQLVIPSNLGYGVRGAGNGAIPPNQTLVFDVTLLKVDRGAPEDPADKQDDQDQQ